MRPGWALALDLHIPITMKARGEYWGEGQVFHLTSTAWLLVVFATVNVPTVVAAFFHKSGIGEFKVISLCNGVNPQCVRSIVYPPRVRSVVDPPSARLICPLSCSGCHNLSLSTFDQTNQK